MRYGLRRYCCVKTLTLTALMLLHIAPLAYSQTHSSKAETPASIPSDQWKNDFQLQRKIHVDTVGTDLQTLLGVLSDKTLTLSCDDMCKDQKLQIRLMQRPLTSLMQALAEMLSGEWHPLVNKHGYRLVMNPAAVRYRERWWSLFLEARKAAFAQQATFLHDQLRKNIEITGPDRAPGEFDLKAGPRFFSILPDNLLEQISNNFDDSAFYSNSSDVRYTPPGDDEGAIILPFTDLPEQAQKLIRDPKNFPPPGSYVRVVNGGGAVFAVVYESDGRQRSNPVLKHVDVSPELKALSLDQSNLAELAAQQGRSTSPTWKQLLAYQNKRFWGKEIAPGRSRANAEFRRADELRLLAARPDMEFVADYYTEMGAKAKMPDALPPIPVEQTLDALAARHDASWKKQDGVYLIRNNRWYRDDLLELPNTLHHLWIAGEIPSNESLGAKITDGSTFSVPVTTVPSQNALGIVIMDTKVIGKHGPTSADEQRSAAAAMGDKQNFAQRLEWESTVVEHLSRWQIENGFRWFLPEATANVSVSADGSAYIPKINPYADNGFPFSPDAERLKVDYHAARFYAGLSSEARAALLRQHLPYSTLNPQQQEQAFHFNPRLRALAPAVAPERILLGLRATTNLRPKPSLVFQLRPSP